MTNPAARLCAILAFLLLALLAGPAALADTERVTSYRVDLTVGRDGGLHVRETIAYDFGAADKHGVYRYVPRLQRADDDRDRRYDLTNVRATADGTAAPTAVTTGRDTEIRVGDPNATVTGAHTYVLEYDVARALTPRPGHDELYWNAVGDGWAATLSAIDVTVTLPVNATAATCHAGPSSSRGACGSATTSGATARFTHPTLDTGEGLTVTVTWPKGAVAIQPPAYDKRPSNGPSPSALVLAACYLLIPLAFLLRGLPRRGGRKPPHPVPEPPPGTRPATAGALLTGRSTALHIVAALTDLAARGELRIEDEGRSTRLVRPGGFDPATAAPHLAPYEVTLLAGLFGHRESVRVKELRGPFTRARATAQEQVLEECVRQGWFRRHPGRQRRRQRIAGAVLLATTPVVLVGVIVLLIRTQIPWGLRDLFLLAGAHALAGAAVMLLSLGVKPLTASGARASAQVKGLREHLRRGPVPTGSPERIAAEVATLLPFAVAFGLQYGYGGLLEAHGVEPPPWFDLTGATGGLAAGLSGFTLLAATTMEPPSSFSGGSSSGSGGSSGGGFSGGGGGGGGGGSW